jgi:hypothetical protein
MEIGPPAADPLFTVLMEIGMLVPGTNAIFFFPVIPGPFIKNPK